MLIGSLSFIDFLSGAVIGVVMNSLIRYLYRLYKESKQIKEENEIWKHNIYSSYTSLNSRVDILELRMTEIENVKEI